MPNEIRLDVPFTYSGKIPLRAVILFCFLFSFDSAIQLCNVTLLDDTFDISKLLDAFIFRVLGCISHSVWA